MPSVWCDVNGAQTAMSRCHGDVGDSLATDVPMSSAVPLLFPPLATFAPVQPVVTLRRIPGSHGVSKRQSDEMMR